MSPRLGRPVGRGDHGRALDLAALRVDEPLPPDDAAWLETHLAGCVACAAAADAYDEQGSLFGPLRAATPEPPRDLWARTAAAIEADGAPGRLGTTRIGRRWRPGGPARVPVVPLAGVLVVAIVVGAGLLNGVNLSPAHEGTSEGGDSAQPTPIPLTAGTVQVLSRRTDGALELSTRHINEVCPVGAASCGTTAVSDSTRLSTLGDLGSFDAVISPNQDHIVVMQRGAPANGVFVVPVREVVQPPPSAVAVTPTPVVVSPSPSATVAPGTPSPATPTPTAPTPPSPLPTATATATAITASSASPDTSATPSTAAPTPDLASPSASVEVTPQPDGTIEIAHDVILVGSVSGYSADGTGFAFTARPSAGSTGPDVYLWQASDSDARPVTSDHASVFSGWLGDRLLVSRVADGAPVTTLLDPETGEERAVDASSMWRPAVAADQRTAVWWAGTVAPAGDGFTWQPASGRLVLGAWPGLTPDPQASAAPPESPAGTGPSAGARQEAARQEQVLASGTIRDWQVRWDETGTAVALWITDGEAGAPGRLSLYAVDPATGAVNLAKPMLENAPAFDGFSLRDGRLAWSAPAESGEATVEVLAWSGDTVGQLRLPTESEVTVLH